MRVLRIFVSFAVALACVSVRAATYVVPTDRAMVDRTDAIVIARALHSHVEDSGERGIETVTEFAVEEVIKGPASLADGMRVRSPGGVIETEHNQRRAKLVPGAPRFLDGERMLLFVRKIGSDDYATTDLGLGSFGFASDDAGHRVLIRADTEINGWNPDGSVHHEPRREADRFLRFLRDVVDQRPASGDYTIAANPLVGDGRSIDQSRPRTKSLAALTATQYSFATSAGVENSQGFRWKTFPAAVNWNRGNAEVNATNGGSDLINAAFASWNGEPSSNVNYVLASTNANTNGINDPKDGVNNVVFEKDMTSRGVAAFSCTTGGVLGTGGITLAITDLTNIVNGEVFYKAMEADVSMNQGLGACLPGGTGQLSVANYLTAMTHEFGHTLGFRHSDLSRDNSQPCSNFASYDCSSSALMNHLLIPGLGGALTAWDTRGVEALYPAPAAPANVVATAASATSVNVAWTAVPGAMSYTIYRSANNSTYSNVGSAATNSFSDSGAFASTAYIYRVTATLWGVESPFSSGDLATTVVFTDPALFAQFVKAAHVTELRTAVDAVRKLANGGAANDFNYTDAVIAAQSTPVNAIDVIELRTALDAARSTLGLSALVYTDPTISAGSTPIRAAHFMELRAGVQ